MILIATIRDIAKLANISASTVSRVLNHDETINISFETKKRIFEAAETLSYTKSKNYKKTVTNTKSFALIHWYNEIQELNDPYFLSIRIGIEHECNENNIILTKIYNNNFYEFPSKKYDGLIVLGKFDETQINNFKNYSKNIVLVHSASKNFEYDSIVADFRQITRDVLDYCISLGHDNIGYIGGRENIIGTDILFEDKREVEFIQYTKKKGIYNENFIKTGSFNYKDGYNFMKELLLSNPPTCIFVGSDTMAIGAIRAINEMGLKIPDDISLIGCNDIPTSKYLTPSLSTVKIYTEFMGRQSVKILMERNSPNFKIKMKYVVPHKIVIRESLRNLKK